MADDSAAHSAWREARQAELAAPDSWFGLTGLYWLDPGSNGVGNDAALSVVLPRGPAYLGDLVVAGDSALWRPAAGEARELATDANGDPDVVEHDGVAFFVIAREGRLAARVRDRRWAEKRVSPGVPCYPYDPDWVIAADWLPLEPPLTLEVPNVSGDLQLVEVCWQAVFSHAGETVALLPMGVKADGVFFVFRDRTSGRETYGAGRFLKTAPPAAGRIVLDFNRAYNPPCAFTPFATCPLPPPENWLGFPVAAGEKTPQNGD